MAGLVEDMIETAIEFAEKPGRFHLALGFQ